jgi:hypothetical protein
MSDTASRPIPKPSQDAPWRAWKDWAGREVARFKRRVRALHATDVEKFHATIVLPLLDACFNEWWAASNAFYEDDDNERRAELMRTDMCLKFLTRGRGVEEAEMHYRMRQRRREGEQIQLANAAHVFASDPWE